MANLDELNIEDILPHPLDADGEVTAAARAIDPELKLLLPLLRAIPYFGRIDELPEDYLDHLAWQYHADAYEASALTERQKRERVKNSILLHRYKGTRWAIRNALENIGFPWVKIQEHWELGTVPFTFGVTLPLDSNGDRETAVENIVEYKPERSHLLWLAYQLNLYEDFETDSVDERVCAWHGTVLKEGEETEERLKTNYGLGITESPWNLKHYSDDRLYYDGDSNYSGYLGVETVHFNAHGSPEMLDSAGEEERFINTLKVIIK